MLTKWVIFRYENYTVGIYGDKLFSQLYNGDYKTEFFYVYFQHYSH